MNRKIFTAALVLCVGAFFFVGCDKGPKKVEITGTVTVDGEPVGKGTIQFDSTDGVGGSDGAAINDGKFTCQLTTGEKKVKVNGSKVVGQFEADPVLNPGKMSDQLEDYEGFPFHQEKTVVIEKKGQVVDLDYSPTN